MQPCRDIHQPFASGRVQPESDFKLNFGIPRKYRRHILLFPPSINSIIISLFVPFMYSRVPSKHPWAFANLEISRRCILIAFSKPPSLHWPSPVSMVMLHCNRSVPSKLLPELSNIADCFLKIHLFNFLIYIHFALDFQHAHMAVRIAVQKVVHINMQDESRGGIMRNINRAKPGKETLCAICSIHTVDSFCFICSMFMGAWRESDKKVNK